MVMDRAQIDRLAEGDRNGVRGYGAMAQRCQERITIVRHELESALHAVDAAAVRGTGVDVAADEALRLTLELDALERVQPRVDAWLRLASGVNANESWLAPFGE